MDLRDDDACAAAVGQVVAAYGGLHTLVYAAGPPVPMKHLSRVSPAELAGQLDADAAAFFRVAAPALPALRETGGKTAPGAGAATPPLPRRGARAPAPPGPARGPGRAPPPPGGRIAA